MPDGYSEIAWRGRTALKCDACPYATTMLSEMRDHLRERHGVRPQRRRVPADAAPAPSLEGIDFASEEAAELAIREGLTAEALRAREPSGKTGGFTVADVKAARTATE